MQSIQNKESSIYFAAITYQINDLIWTFAFILAAVLAPTFLAHTPANQWITGTAVNAILFLAVWRTGIVNAIFVAFLPSSIALLRGLLPPPMAIFIPYIIISNIILICIFYALKKHPFTGVFIASFIKFLFLFVVSFLFAKVAGPLLCMMRWSQLVTALSGGLIAVGIIKLKK